MAEAVLVDDLQIARSVTLKPIAEVAASLGLDVNLLEPYGRDVAKVQLAVLDQLAGRPLAKYVVVTAVTPTPLGEGKTATAVGLAQAFGHVGKRATVTIRQAAMGPVFGIKGGAAGGGWAQVLPMEKVNLHLTGDTHAVTAAHNLLSAMVDNHLFHGNALGIDPHEITWPRVLDVNDRALRHIVVGLGARIDGVPRQAGFDITAASEVMAILALATSLHDLRERLGRIVVGYTRDGHAVTAEQLQAAGSMAVILREALMPNLLQTLEHSAAFVHGGPFGNIAHGSSSILADQIGLRVGDYLVTEAGFGADIGAEKFFDIKCRASGMHPDAAVIVATVRALKMHSGRHRIVAGRPLPAALGEESPEEVLAGAANLRKHVQIVSRFGVTPVIAINAFPGDYPSEHDAIRAIASDLGVRVAVTTAVADGGSGGVDLARAVMEAANEPNDFRLLYPDDASLREKIEAVATEIYGADGVDYAAPAARALDHFELLGYGHLPVCIAKTHLSISHDPSLLGAPTGWRLPVREVRAHVGAGFIYPICGNMPTMPGLGSTPAATRIDIADDGEIIGLS